uniref:RB1-inducible coiled-coil protein 1 n=1 Tax=Aceria tosichella TaxID=561515 RepID=A0A6G1SNZ5_9ACAR
MLYVFQVDTGTMMTFDMKLVTETVAYLKKTIAMKTDIPEDKQVLLISGGESLTNTQRICSYSSAGTDTSPIFLFAKINIEAQQPPQPSIEFDDDTDMMEMIESCMSMQPSLDTLVARTELAADLNEQASKQRETCEKLVHDQHLQQQGWAAVTANLEDLTRAFKNKSEMLLLAFNEFTKCKSRHEELLKKFSDDMKQLDAVPILPTLLEGNKLLQPSTSTCSGDSAKSAAADVSGGKSGPRQERSTKDVTVKGGQDKSVVDQAPNKAKNSGQSESPMVEEHNSEDNAGASSSNGDDADSTATTNDEDTKQSEDEFLDANQETDKLSPAAETTETKSTPSSEKLPPTTDSSNPAHMEEAQAVTLRQWIDFHDSHSSLERLIELCWRGLERFNETNAESIRFEVQELLKSANNSNMKEIKGLEERLFGLEKLMDDAKKVVDEQCQLASSFQNNRERFSKIKDLTLLPDLSASHKQQLQMMLANHKKMNDYRDRCLRAKHELSVNLHARLKWIMYIEQQISDLDGKLMIYKENLLRLNRHFEIIDQVHKAPNLYLASCVEALRRRRFSRRYLHWANSIAKISQELYENEMTTRKEFDSKLGSHFLSTLFPGLTRSYPPPFATKQPDPFDTKLPRITAADIQYLQANLCDELAANLYIPKDVPMPHIISAPHNLDDSTANVDEAEDLDDRHSLNPTPPSSPTKQPQYGD